MGIDLEELYYYDVAHCVELWHTSVLENTVSRTKQVDGGVESVVVFYYSFLVRRLRQAINRVCVSIRDCNGRSCQWPHILKRATKAPFIEVSKEAAQSVCDL